MISQIKIYSRQEIKDHIECWMFKSLTNCVVISIIDNPKYVLMTKDLINNTGCEDCISLDFYDLTLSDQSSKKMFSKRQAKQIIQFLDKHSKTPENLTLIVHCNAGICRSGAVGLFACRYLKLDETDFLNSNHFIYPNTYVLNMLEEVSGMKKTTFEEYNKLFGNYEMWKL
jgi:predicted protein tyrosine phosphatase